MCSQRAPAKAPGHAFKLVSDHEAAVGDADAEVADYPHKRPDLQLHTAMTGRDGIKAAIDDQPALILLTTAFPTSTASKSCSSLLPPPPPPRSPSSSSAATRTPRPSTNSSRRALRISWSSRSTFTNSWQSSDVTSTDRRGPHQTGADTRLSKPDATSRPGQRRSAPGMAWQAGLSTRDRRAG